MGALLCMTKSRRNGAGCVIVGVPFGSILPRFNCGGEVSRKKSALVLNQIEKSVNNVLPSVAIVPSEMFLNRDSVASKNIPPERNCH